MQPVHVEAVLCYPRVGAILELATILFIQELQPVATWHLFPDSMKWPLVKSCMGASAASLSEKKFLKIVFWKENQLPFTETTSHHSGSSCHSHNLSLSWGMAQMSPMSRRWPLLEDNVWHISWVLFWKGYLWKRWVEWGVMREEPKGVGPSRTGNNARDASVGGRRLDAGQLWAGEMLQCGPALKPSKASSLMYPPPFKDYNGESWYCGH